MKFTSVVIPRERYSHQLRILPIIPHQQLVTRWHVFDGPVIYTAVVLEYNHVLFFLVARTAHEGHPVALVVTVQVVTHFTIVEYLEFM